MAAAPTLSLPKLHESGVTFLASVPADVDAAWWRRHAHLVRDRGEGSLRFERGAPLELPARCAPPPAETAFGGLLGQEDRVARLRRMVEGSRRRGKALPHLLLSGPAGTDKTALARGIAAAAGRSLVVAAVPSVGDRAALVRLLVESSEGGLLFLDEVNALSRPLLAILLQALSERRLTFVLSDGTLARHVALRLPPVTLIAGTTDEGAIPLALHSRFGLYEALLPRGEEVLVEDVRPEAATQPSPTRRVAAPRTARAARVPHREAPGPLVRALDDLAPDGWTLLDGPAVERTLARSLGTTPRVLVERVEPRACAGTPVHTTHAGGTAAPDGRRSRMANLVGDGGAPNVRQALARAFSSA